MDNLKDALQYVVGLSIGAEKTEVLEINGKTYADKNLTRYDKLPKAERIKAATLSSLVDYIYQCNKEFPGSMIIHIVSPTRVCLMSALDKEREREVLFEVNAETSEFRFDQWYDQERFMIELQANFQSNSDLEAVMKLAGNIESKNSQNYTDDGTTQVATITVGVATKADALVPNPVELIPYRTFQEVEQPASKFVFRIGDKEAPAFKIVEAEGGIWKNEAISNIKAFLAEHLSDMVPAIKNGITVIG
ncbi:hypothetical protein [Lacrimispora indolis]|uniref:hypothetical protein n=1 Tax=Lacrimispora indolis TaxID=69825 RepID=UPI0004067191|nr:hypothetical protein [[Clostridium] methoxybenzovorans]